MQRKKKGLRIFTPSDPIFFYFGMCDAHFQMYFFLMATAYSILEYRVWFFQIVIIYKLVLVLIIYLFVNICISVPFNVFR
jgi:hypothetical protein